VGYGSCDNYLSLGSGEAGVIFEDDAHFAKMRRCLCTAVPYGHLMGAE
jgi:hypothetical protein